jgi:hypothetical protein
LGDRGKQQPPITALGQHFRDCDRSFRKGLRHFETNTRYQSWFDLLIWKFTQPGNSRVGIDPNPRTGSEHQHLITYRPGGQRCDLIKSRTRITQNEFIDDRPPHQTARGARRKFGRPPQGELSVVFDELSTRSFNQCHLLKLGRQSQSQSRGELRIGVRGLSHHLLCQPGAT